MAYYRQYKGTVATYESCSTSAFKHGRTETIRPATAETKRACMLFVDDHPIPSTEELKNAMLACSKKHGTLTRNAAMGTDLINHCCPFKTWNYFMFILKFLFWVCLNFWLLVFLVHANLFSIFERYMRGQKVKLFFMFEVKFLLQLLQNIFGVAMLVLKKPCENLRIFCTCNIHADLCNYQSTYV